jgi:hypothetical protein
VCVSNRDKFIMFLSSSFHWIGFAGEMSAMAVQVDLRWFLVVLLWSGLDHRLSVLWTFVLALLAMLLVVFGHINGVVPTVVHEIHALTAGTVFMAMLVPVLDMIMPDMQVNGLLDDHYLLDNNGFGVYEPRGRIVTNVYLAIEPRFSQRDGYSHITGKCRQSGNGK